MLTDQLPVYSSAWINVDRSTKIAYRIDPDCDGAYAEFSFFGPTELGLSMSRETVQRCRDLFNEALTEMDTQP